MCLCAGDAVWHAGGGPAGLAEEHCVPSLHQEQQTDHLVLAGKVMFSMFFTLCPSGVCVHQSVRY